MTYLTFAENSIARAGSERFIRSDRVRPAVLRDKKQIAFLSVLAIAFIAILAAFNLVSANSMVKLGYDLRESAKFKRTVEEKQKELEIAVSRIRSVQSFESVIQSRGLANVEKISYIKSEQSSLAHR